MRPFHPWMLLAPLSIVGAATLEGLWITCLQGRYDWRAYLASLGDLLLRLASGVLPLGLAAGAFDVIWQHRWYSMPLTAWWPWVLLFFGQDFLYYWMHRADHRVRWFWATHSVHHSPTELNLSAAYRLGFTSRISMAPLFFAPLVLVGFPPLVVGAALGLNLSYQFWLHAPWIPTLGPLEWVLNTPAHHRVHHACNPEYLDRNFGGVLIVFDRLFGTFARLQPGIVPRYGVAGATPSYNPLRTGLEQWFAMLREVGSARSPQAVLRAVFGPPGAHAATALSTRAEPTDSQRRQSATPQQGTVNAFLPAPLEHPIARTRLEDQPNH